MDADESRPSVKLTLRMSVGLVPASAISLIRTRSEHTPGCTLRILLGPVVRQLVSRTQSP